MSLQMSSILLPVLIFGCTYSFLFLFRRKIFSNFIEHKIMGFFKIKGDLTVKVDSSERLVE